MKLRSYLKTEFLSQNHTYHPHVNSGGDNETNTLIKNFLEKTLGVESKTGKKQDLLHGLEEEEVR